MVQVEVRFSEAITITESPDGDNPYILVDIGGESRQAVYNYSEDNWALFRYVVKTGDVDDDGISIDADSISLNGGTINDATGVAAKLAHDAVADQTGHKVSAPRLAISGIDFNSQPRSDNRYTVGDYILVQVRFGAQRVTVTGTPQLTVNIGGNDRKFNYSGEDTVLFFNYQVVSGDEDYDGISIAANSLSLNGGSMTDSNGDAVSLEHGAVAADARQQVFAPSVPKIAKMSIQSNPGDDDTYEEGDVIEVYVEFSESVTITDSSEGDSPELTINVGGDDRTASFVGNDNATLRFQYTVAVGDEDADGVSIDADSLALNGATIKSTADEDAAVLTHSALADDAEHMVSAPGGL